MLHVDVLYTIKRKKYKTVCAELAFTKSPSTEWSWFYIELIILFLYLLDSWIIAQSVSRSVGQAGRQSVTHSLTHSTFPVAQCLIVPPFLWCHFHLILNEIKVSLNRNGSLTHSTFPVAQCLIVPPFLWCHFHLILNEIKVSLNRNGLLFKKVTIKILNEYHRIQ